MEQEFPMIVDNKAYKVVANEESKEVIALTQFLDNFQELAEHKESVDYQYDVAKMQLEKACANLNEKIGFKSLKGFGRSIVFVKGTDGEVKKEKKLNEPKIKELLNELGLDLEDYMIETEKKTGARKDSVRISFK